MFLGEKQRFWGVGETLVLAPETKVWARERFVSGREKKRLQERLSEP